MTLPSASRTLVIMLGASTYPRSTSLDNPRFERSARALQAYFTDPLRFGLPQDQLLWLFDSPKGPTELNEQLESFLDRAMSKPDDERPQDIIVSFVGHGFFDDENHYYLAINNFNPRAPEYSYRFKLLQSTIRHHAQQARKYFILDACYSAAAASELMSAEPVVHQIKREVAADAAADLPMRGTALLCAASKNDQAIAPSADEYTMFSGAMLSVLQEPSTAGALNLRQLHSLISAHIRAKHGELSVQPEIYAPGQQHGDVGDIPLFTLRYADAATATDVDDALSPSWFTETGLIHAVVVGRRGHPGELPGLVQQVGDAWHNHHKGISAAADLCRAAWRAQRVPLELGEGSLKLSHLIAEEAFKSEESLRLAVVALCRAEIAVFDLSDWDPAVTFLLGVRSVVRRGVTVTSLASVDGKEFRVGGAFSMPFNLQLLNLAAHSESQETEGTGKRPYELLGTKIENGFRELANLPHYLDLPAYDAIRQLGTESGAYRAVAMHERILMLCPFSETYQKKNWPRLEKMLPSCVRDHVEKTEGRKDVSPPQLARLLDLRTPRLVAQTLFEAIRLIDMCVIDWTDKRINVVFEAGVRLAAHPLGAIHVLEEGAWEQLEKSKDPADIQVRAILRLLAPITYPLGGVSTKKFTDMVQRFATTVQAYNGGQYQLIYATAGKELDRRAQPAAMPLANELLRSANILEPDDEESAGVSAVLYHDVNRELVTEASAAAADRRLAAWLFLARRYGPEHIAADQQRREQFEFLTLRVKRWARRVKRRDLLAEIDDVANAVSAHVNGQGSNT